MASKTVLSNVDIIRRFVYDNQPVSLESIVAELRAQMTSLRTDEMAKNVALQVLSRNPYFHESAEGWTIATEELPEYRMLPEIFRMARQVMFEREVRTKVAQQLGSKVGNILLDLERAPGLRKFGSRWGLSDWVLAHEQAAEVLGGHTGGLSEKDLLKQVCDRYNLDPETTIVNLTGDKRFVLERKVWQLKEQVDKKATANFGKSTITSRRKEKLVDLKLEEGFLEAQVGKTEEAARDDGERLLKSRLRKALKKQAQDIIEQREDLQPKPEDFAARMSQVLSAAGVDEYGVKSFQRVETAPKERGLSPKERDEIQQFINQLLEQDTVGVGASVQSVVNAPLSARKMQDVLRLKYINYTLDRAVIPNEYYRFLVEVLRPTINQAVLHPSVMEGYLAVELFGYLYDHLEGAAWALTDDGGNLEIVQLDGARYRLSAQDPQLIELARDKFIVSQVDLLNHYLNNRYTAVEGDKVLAKAARIVTRLSGFENAYIVSRDFLAELPEVFGYPANENNSIPERFDMILGNYTFAQDPNLAANYLDTSLKLLAPGGKLGVFVLTELLTLLKEHGLLGDFLRGMGVTHFIRLPLVEGRHKVVLLVVEALATEGRSDKPIITAEVKDLKGASSLSHALREGTEPDGNYHLTEAQALGTLIA